MSQSANNDNTIGIAVEDGRQADTRSKATGPLRQLVWSIASAENAKLTVLNVDLRNLRNPRLKNSLWLSEASVA